MLSVQQFFDQKWHDSVPHPPYSQDVPTGDFFCVSLDEKSPQGKHFADVEEAKQKMAEALKSVKIDEFKKLLRSQKKKEVSVGVLHQMESTWKVTKV